MIPPYYRNVNLEPEADLHPFARLHDPMKNPYLVVEYAEGLGMGSRNCELIEFLSVKETMKRKPPTGVSEGAPSFF
jgi:hypothetical protein